MREFKGRHTAARGLGLVLGLVLACTEDPPAEGCATTEDCPEGQKCVILAADASFGACVEPVFSPGIPGDLGHSPIELTVDNRLDILFVVDDSAAIAPRLPQLADAMTGFAGALLAAEPKLSLRFGVTTTDAGNPRCTAAPERGALRIDSCRARLDEYVDPDSGLDARAACTDACSLESLALEPSRADDDALAVRPWIEVTPHGDNLPDGVGLAEALRCAVPQGIAGCEFTSPLAGFAQAIARTQNDADPAFGFLRPDADLLIVVVSAGNDCSLAAGHEAIFSDNPVFWGDLQLPDLSPAICWRAGVACEGPGPNYPACGPVDLGDDGQPTGPDAAVLTPPQRITQLLEELHVERQSFAIGARVAVFTIAGVPSGYPEGQAIEYADADDPAFQTQHGIGPGCSDSIAAPPPVRLLAAAAPQYAYEGAAAESICRADWSDGFTRVAAAALDDMLPSCFPQCVQDVDPAAPGLDVLCEVVAANFVESWSFTVPPCVREDGAWVAPAGSPRCYLTHVGDDLDPRCADEGYNLELEVVTFAAEPAYTEYRAACRLSPNLALDCPLL